ncbi:MAG: DUF1801 domain-containing protein [Flavobacteriales bacterium]|nr:DUF1801 domain-containing protein [Flavobacteriales bacterium]
MSKLEVNTDPRVEDVFANYPDHVREKMRQLRELVLETAKETPSISALEETLKWGEPSYLTKHGSTLRMDWKERTPDQYAMYFKCTSRLVDTFRLVHGPAFTYEGKRAIVFQLDQKVPVRELKACIRAALTYHKVKGSDTWVWANEGMSQRNGCIGDLYRPMLVVLCPMLDRAWDIGHRTGLNRDSPALSGYAQSACSP